MSGQLYALLVGIDDYPAPVPRLRGCRNDIDALEQLLSERVAEADRQVVTLLDADARRDAVIAGFENHLAKAGPDDVALFWFSGHGSQEIAPREFWPVEPDHLDETLVCHDSRTEGQFDLADKEVAQLLAEVAANGAHVVVVLDCCHSGSGTRGDEDGGQAVRRAPVDRRDRPLGSLRLSPTALSRIGAAAPDSPDAPPSGWLVVDEGRHVLLAACRSTQTAKEVVEAGRQRGALSAALEQALRAAPTIPTYRDLMTAVGGLVRDVVAEQNPQLEYTDPADVDRPFLGGAVRARGASYTLGHDPAAGWVIDAGAVHGIPQPDGEETTVLAVFPAGTDDDGLRQADLALTSATVTAVEPSRSLVTPTATDGLDTARTYRAVARVLPLTRYAVSLGGDPPPALTDALVASLLLVVEPEKAEAHVEALDATFRITRAGTTRRLVTDVDAVEKVISRLEHIARWRRTRSLRNPASALGPGAVLMEVLDPDTRTPITSQDAEVVLRYADGAPKGPKFVVRLTNTTDRELHCALLGLDEAYAVTSKLIKGGRVLLPPGGTVLTSGGKPIRATVPDDWFAAGVDRYTDTLKVIACTEEFDASQLDQPELDVPIPRHKGVTRGAAPRTTLQRLVDRMQTRTLALDDEEDEHADWVTSDLSIVTERGLGATPIGAVEATLSGSAVVVAPHPSLRASARVRSEPGPARDALAALLPPLLRDEPGASEPFPLSSTRSGAAEATVLELRDVENWRDVTPADPLRLQVPMALHADEFVLPVGFDGEFYLPLGGVSQRRADGVEIRLDALPEPVTDRSLFGSIKILFRKLVLKPLGVPDPYPLLSLVTSDGSGGLTYDTRAVAAAVAGADRVLLYVHGILGDTRGLVTSAFPDGLAAAYDAVLAFDYENLDTRIDGTAALLRARLDEVGLRPGGTTRLDVVAHSMGGLVVRWLVEHLDGAEIVSTVTTLGTPNAGSPWPRVQDWAFSALSVGLNALAATFWPAGVVAGLVGLVERVDSALDDMAPGSDRLQKLFAAPDPHLPYTVLVGNRSLIERPEPDGAVARLLARISPTRLIDPAVALAFLGAPNDLAVAVSSAEHLPSGRSPAPDVRQIACDHLSYFTDPVGRDALAAALGVRRT